MENEKHTLQKKIERYVIQEIKRLLPQESSHIDWNIHISEMGIKKRLLVQQIETQAKIKLSPTIFFEYETIAELSAYLYQQHKDAFASLLTNEQVDDIPNIELGSNHCDTSSASNEGNDIAIIGMSGKFPMADNVQQFWKNIIEQRDVIREVPKNRWDIDKWFSAQKAPNKTYCKWGGFINDVDKFDPLFFGISPKEATWMDPQLRVLLETIYASIEDAGYGKKIRGTNTGVYIGTLNRDYWDEIARRNIAMNSSYEYISNMGYMLSGRISHIFDLQGPCIPVDNACASSLAAIYLAVQALRSGTCSLAFAAATNLIFSPLRYIAHSQIGTHSPSGRCHSFTDAADGYVPSEGVVALLLKPLTSAVKDRDNIHAVIKGTAINHTGKSQSIFAPRPKLQTSVIVEAWQDAKIAPTQASYIEAHGTGTKLGDPIEIQALTKSFAKYTNKKQFCHIGSIKSQIGHLEATAGLAGVAKVVLSMQHKKIPGLYGYQNPNPLIEIDNTPFIINRETIEWQAKKRIAGISSFGITGNNAHIVIEEYQKPQVQADSAYPAIFVLSAKSDDQLQKYIDNWKKYLQETPIACFASVLYSLQAGREEMDFRLAIVANDPRQLQELLSHYPQPHQNIFCGKKQQNTTSCSEVQQKSLHEIAHCWVQGQNVDWQALYATQPWKVSLPTYPFARNSYWIPQDSEISVNDNPTTALAGFPSKRLPGYAHLPYHYVWEVEISAQEMFIQQQKMQDNIFITGGVYIEIITAAAQHIHNKSVTIENMQYEKILFLSDNERKTIQVILHDSSFSIHSKDSKDSSDWQLCVHGQISLGEQNGL